MGSNAITMFKGDNRTLQLTVTGVADIAGATITMTVKADPTVPDVQAALQLTTADPAQITITGAITASVYLVPADTGALDARSYVYDIAMQLAGKTYTLLKDDFTLQQDVTLGA